jgi:hypothetical protein
VCLFLSLFVYLFVGSYFPWTNCVKKVSERGERVAQFNEPIALHCEQQREGSEGPSHSQRKQERQRQPQPQHMDKQNIQNS